MFERFLCMLVFLGLASAIPNFSARSNICTKLESRCQCFLTDLMLSFKNILVPFLQLWCKSFNFIKNILGRNKNHYGLEWQQRGFQSLGFCDSIFVPIPASVDDFKLGYSWGEITAYRKVTRSLCISRKKDLGTCVFPPSVSCIDLEAYCGNSQTGILWESTQTAAVALGCYLKIDMPC